LAQYSDPSPKKTFPAKSSQIKFVTISLPGPNPIQKFQPIYGSIATANDVKLNGVIFAVPTTRPQVMACAPQQRTNMDVVTLQRARYGGVKPSDRTDDGWTRHLPSVRVCAEESQIERGSHQAPRVV
jgi:hypothetical protein